ncbi:MAG TPA: hypothetical protein VFP52_01850 [Myxococcales bacterium]|nr:hypothetical protein [Myxococcales bacterium]
MGLPGNAAVVLVLAAAFAPPSRASEVDVRAQLQVVAGRSVFFGHQSVGMNLIDGLRRLAADQGVPLRVVEEKGALDVPAGTFAHAYIAENGDPMRKLRSFAQALDGAKTEPALAMMKFCFVDFRPDTDARALFAAYQETLGALKARHPGIAFVHVTTPLTTVQGGLKGGLKRLLGKAPYGLLENARRDEYNALLRAAYRGREPFFDLAEAESTRADGSRETADWHGAAVPALAPAYTRDGAHLAGDGQMRAARAFLAVLASVPLRAGVAPSQASRQP